MVQLAAEIERRKAVEWVLQTSVSVRWGAVGGGEVTMVGYICMNKWVSNKTSRLFPSYFMVLSFAFLADHTRRL
jgi:hypothetical protein